MSNRLKIYYPESQIEKNLFTKGKEWMTQEGEEYTGYYHKYSTGEVFSEAEFDKKLSEKLIPYDERYFNRDILDIDKREILDNNRFHLNTYKSPKAIRREITEEDKENGFIIRYFIRKRNDVNAPVLEINEEQYNSLSPSEAGIDGYLYFGIELKWKISGILNDVWENNKRVKSGVIDTNRRTIFSKNREMKGIKNYLTDLTEFYQR